MSVFNPTYDTYFTVGDNGVTHSDVASMPVSEKSFVACKFALSSMDEVESPVVKLSVYVVSSNILGNEIGMLGLYEMSDSNWIGSDSYDSVNDKVSVSPMAVSEPISSAGWHCDDEQLDVPVKVEFEVPASVIKHWRRNHLSQVSLAIAIYGDFEYGGVVMLGSSESEYPFELLIDEDEPVPVVPYDVVVNPSTISPGSRASITIVTPDRTFESNVDDMVVTIDGEPATIISGNEHSIKIVVPDIPGKIEGMAELLVSDVDGTALSNVSKVYYNASATKRNKVFVDPSRPGGEDERLSNAAVYNRDLGFYNFVEITDENSLVQNIYNILLTRKGERLFNSEFGTTIEERVFSIMNEDDETSILQECFAAIQEYEPRVSVDYDESRVELDYDSNTIRIVIAVVLPSGSSEYIVLPFKSRGTLVR